MTVNANATAFRQNEAGDDYDIVAIPRCMWQEQSAQQFIGNGLVDADTIKIFIPDTATDIRKDDMVVRQTVTEITDEIIKAARTVRAVSIFDYGTPEMRHIEAVV